MKRSIQFIILTCLVSLAVAGIAIFLGIRETKTISYMIFGMFYMLLPASCAIILQLIHKEKPFRNLSISFRFNRWFIIAGFVPIIAAFMALGISLFFPNVSFSSSFEGVLQQVPDDKKELAMEQLLKFPPAIFLLISVLQAIAAGYTINAVFAFGEELGWRGYL